MERLSEYSDLEPEADWRKENIVRQSDGTWMKKVNYYFDLDSTLICPQWNIIFP